MNNDTVNAATTRPLDPDLEARLAEVRAQKQRRLRLRDRIKKERRILFPCLTIAALAHFNLSTAMVDGHSMEPTLHTGDKLYVWKSYHYFTTLKPGDLVLVRMKHSHIAGEEIVKRVVFVQNATGDAVWPENIPTPEGPHSSRQLFMPYVDGQWSVPANEIMVMGDNYENSMDSRDFGPIRLDEIDGKVINH